MRLQESGEMYLETIYILGKEGETVRSIDVADRMEVTKPSVSRAVSLLKSGGFVEMEANGNLILTDKGLRIAEKTYERHTVLSSFFEKLGVSPDTAAEDACKIEHDISDETFDAIKAHYSAKTEN